MGMKNLRKYICEDCGCTQMLKPYVFSLASKPRCSDCGSTFLKLSKTSLRKDEERIINDIKKSGIYKIAHKK